MKDKDGLNEAQRKYHEKVTSQQPLEEDAGGLGKNRHGYERRQAEHQKVPHGPGRKTGNQGRY